MKMNEAFPSKYLKADVDVPEEGTLVVTMTDVEMESMGKGADADDKPVVYFKEVEKGLVLNKTNANTIAKLYGDESDDWEGKQISLVSADVEFQGKMMRGIRVSSRKPKGKPEARPVAAVAAVAAKVGREPGDDEDEDQDDSTVPY